MDLLAYVQQAVARFKQLPADQPLRIIANYDADGIAAAALLLKMFHREGRTCSVSIIGQLNQEVIQTLYHEPYTTYFFLDLGANLLSVLTTHLLEKHLFIFDHHYFDKAVVQDTGVVHVNPYLCGMDGTKDISAAGVAYLFACCLNSSNRDLSVLALVGALGDAQEDHGFQGINQDILQDAVDLGLMDIKEGLRLFGARTKPLYKVLSQLTNPYLPSITGNERAALAFLEELDIPSRDSNGYRWLHHLHRDELQRLYDGLLVRKTGGLPIAEKLFGPIYLLPRETIDTPLHDAREYATLLNACGKTNKASYALGACLGDTASLEKAIRILSSYHREITNALRWFYEQRGKAVLEQETSVLIRAETAIRDSLIGVVTSLLSKSNLYPEGTVLLGLSHTLGGEVKVSCRISGDSERGPDLRRLMHETISITGGQGGGHPIAAGAIIPQEKEELFLATFLEQLQKQLLEEHL